MRRVMVAWMGVAFCGSPAYASEPHAVELPINDAPWTGDLDGMIERQRVRVLVVESRTNYFLDGAIPRGLTYDALRSFESELNKGRKGPIRIEVVFVPTRPDDLIPGLIEGRGDIAAANLTITPERSAQVDFGPAWLHGVRELVVTGPASPNVATLDDLSGKEVYVRRSSSYYESLARINESYGLLRPKIKIREVPETLEEEDLLEMLDAGLIPLTVVDDHLAKLWDQVLDHVTVRDDLAVHEAGEIAWAFRKDSPKLRAEVEAFAKVHHVGTTAANMKLREYLRSTRHLKNATTGAHEKRFRDVAVYFQSYGKQYGFDWLLMTAQGFRESGLDQNVKSPVGAIGVMQLMPPTGAAMAVGDIRRAENNIHAGIKYMRTMLDVYFKDAPMDDMNRALFAFASYNAGPGRVAQLRREAEKTGLDPNVWFGNVEQVAARRIGQETVRYVRDIYKYYIAYRLTTDFEEERARARRQLEASDGAPPRAEIRDPS
jgi:membrane-bound lytic murein transglycosylase MltF